MMAVMWVASSDTSWAYCSVVAKDDLLVVSMAENWAAEMVLLTGVNWAVCSVGEMGETMVVEKDVQWAAHSAASRVETTVA